MCDDRTFCVLGSDDRSEWLRKLYKGEGKRMASVENADIVIGPIPFSRDDLRVNGENLKCEELIKILSDSDKILFAGAISQNLKVDFSENNVIFFDLLDEKNVAILNAIPTAEGAIKLAIDITNFTIHGSNSLVLGYGKIGKVLSKMLHGIGANVFCEARKKVIIDLASTPGGVDFVKANELNLNTSWALALPSKVAPLTAAKYLKDTVDELLLKG